VVALCLLPTEVDTLTALSTFPPAYPYLNFNSDPNVCAFFTALNQVQQARLNAMNGLNLPVYVNLTGPLLDFVCVGLYGVQRPAYQGVVVDDDIYWRTVCWQHFKGDGFQFNERWLKRRIARFLNECGNSVPPSPPAPPPVVTGIYTLQFQDLGNAIYGGYGVAPWGGYAIIENGQVVAVES